MSVGSCESLGMRSDQMRWCLIHSNAVRYRRPSENDSTFDRYDGVGRWIMTFSMGLLWFEYFLSILEDGVLRSDSRFIWFLFWFVVTWFLVNQPSSGVQTSKKGKKKTVDTPGVILQKDDLNANSDVCQAALQCLSTILLYCGPRIKPTIHKVFLMISFWLLLLLAFLWKERLLNSCWLLAL